MKNFILSTIIILTLFSCSQPTDYESSNIDSSEIWLRIQQPGNHYEYFCGPYLEIPESYDFVIDLMYQLTTDHNNQTYKIFYDISEFNDNALELYQIICNYSKFEYNSSKYDGISVYNRSRTYYWGLSVYGKTKSGQIAWLYAEGETNPEEVTQSLENVRSENIRVK